MLHLAFLQDRQLPRCGKVGETGGLREAIATAAGQHPVDSGLKVYLMPDGNVDRFYPSLGPQRSTDNLAIIQERGIRARLLP